MFKITLNKPLIFKTPVFFLVMIGIIYYLIGTMNITNHRGVMDWNLSLKVLLYGSSGLILGGMCCRVRLFPKIKLINGSKIALYIGNILWLVGVFISIYMIMNTGLLMFSGLSHLRYLTSAKLLYMQELLLVIPVLYHFTLSLNGDCKSIYIRMMIPLTVFFLLVSGYRGISIIFIISLFIIYYLHPNRKIKINLSKIFIGLISIYLILAGGFLLRRSLSDELIPVDEIVYSLGYPNNTFAKSMLPIYLTFREGVGVFQNLYYKGSGTENIFISDLLTIMPGKQKSGGSKVAEIVYGVKHYDYGLTPTLYGALYYDGGMKYLLLITFIIGYIINRLYIMTKIRYNSTSIILFSIFFTSSLHLMHRGIYKPMYIFYIVTLVLLILIAEIIHLLLHNKLSS